MKDKDAAIFGFLEIEKKCNALQKGLNFFFLNLFKNTKYVVLINDKNKSLPTKYKMPGGKQEFGESEIECLKREIEEELGIKVSVSYEDKDIFWLDNTTHAFFVCRINKLGDEKMEARDCENFFIFSRKKIKQMIVQGEILPNHVKALEYFLGQK